MGLAGGVPPFLKLSFTVLGFRVLEFLGFRVFGV